MYVYTRIKFRIDENRLVTYDPPQVTGEGEDKYLIATSEQPLCAMHRNTWQDPKVISTLIRGNLFPISESCNENCYKNALT